MAGLLVVLLLSVALSSAKHVDLPPPFNDDCIVKDGVNLYDPAGQFDIPWYNVDLDLPPDQRWEQIATLYKDNIAALLQVIKDLFLPIFPDALVIVDDLFGEMADKMPQPYRDEMKSIAKFTGIPLGEIVMYNIFYEIFTVCTSVVATDANGKMYHARDLDFGLFMGWNETTHEWKITTVLKTMIVNINWIQNGKLLYKSNNFAGFIGIYNGVRPNAFTVTANDRFQLKGGYVGMIEWALGLDPNGKWMTWNTREVLETATNYDEAMDQLMNNKLLSPVYYIVGGTKPFEGAIISRSLDKTDILTEMNQTDPNGWYLLQTNYDPNTVPLYLDDRQTPGDICMRALTRDNVGFQGIYNVLSSRTNLNKLTAYTVLMQVDTGLFETHLQSCPGDCWPW